MERKFAFEQLVANKGAAGVDGIGFMDFSLDVRAKWPLVKIRSGHDVFQF